MSGMSWRSAVAADVVGLTGGISPAMLVLVALTLVAAPALAQRSEVGRVRPCRLHSDLRWGVRLEVLESIINAVNATTAGFWH